jgi:hypothetical protein
LKTGKNWVELRGFDFDFEREKEKQKKRKHPLR